MFLSVAGVVGGVETYIFNISRLLKDAYRTWAIVGYANALHHYGESSIEKVVFLPMTKLTAIVFFLKVVRRLRRAGPVILHSNDLVSSLWAKLIALCLGRQSVHVTTIHSVLTEHRSMSPWKQHVLVLLHRLLHRAKQNAVICVSKQVLGGVRALGIAAQNTVVVYNGVEVQSPENAMFPPERGVSSGRPTDPQRGSSHGSVRIGFVGRLSHEKGPDLFLRCVSNLARPFEAHIFGDGIMRHLFADADPDQFTLHGFVSDKNLMYATLDVVCITSRTEAMPFVLLEALAAGCRVLALRLPVFNELLGETSLGTDILCNSIEEMRSRIEQIDNVRLPTERAETLAFLNRFDNKTFGERMRRLYNDIAPDWGPRSKHG